MRTLVSYPGTAVFAQQVALAFHENDALDAFVTTFAYCRGGKLSRLLDLTPKSLRAPILRELERRSVSFVPVDLLRTYPFWDIARTAISRSGANPTLVDRVWDRMAQTLDAHVAKRYVPQTEAIYAYEYTARTSFERARAEGVVTILDLPSLNSRAFEELQRNERDTFPELRSRNDAYFGKKFEERQARRDAEIALADVIVANSSLTKHSHVSAGADPSKIVVVPLAAPGAIASMDKPCVRASPFRVLWAGSFSLGKGAHYFLEAWRRLAPGSHTQADVYGSLQIPSAALNKTPDGIVFHGPIVQGDLFAHFEAADVLVLPTLSDGFGLVVLEAFSHGLPVIVTDRAGATDFVRHGINGLIVPAADAGALRDALQWCLDNRTAIHEMRYAALETAKRWQWPDYRRALISGIDAGLRRAGCAPAFAAVKQTVNAA